MATISGTSGGDQLYGTDEDDIILGRAGNDSIYAGSVNNPVSHDQLYGEAGDDQLVIYAVGDSRTDFYNLADGGDGFDTVIFDFSNFTDALRYEHNGTSADVTAGRIVGRLVSIERIIFTGGQGADWIAGGGNEDWIKGGAGNDQLFGGAGDDQLDGGSGDDVIEGGDGDDSIAFDIGGSDRLDGGAGTDMLNFNAHIDQTGFTIDLQASTLVYPGRSVTISSFEDVNGSQGNDTLLGTDGKNYLWGSSGDDVIFGRAGDDRLFGGPGNDRIDGGSGFDTAIYLSGRQDTTFIRESDGSITVISREGRDTLTGIERIEFFQTGAVVTQRFARPTETLVYNFSAGEGGWTSQDLYPRHLADVNGDGFTDIIGFGASGVLVSFGSRSGIFSSNPGLVVSNFGQAAGWTSDNQFHRELADVNGDGRADIIGFGIAGTFVSLAKVDGTFDNPNIGIADFGRDQGWADQDGFARTTGDVNGDGYADLIGFGYAGTLVSLGNGDGTFGGVVLAADNFGVDQGWVSDGLFHRAVADVNGDGKDDLIGFGYAGTLVALSNGDGSFGEAQLALDEFGLDQGWTDQDVYTRLMGDVNGDGLSDIVGFGHAGTFVALGQSDGTFDDARFDVVSFGYGQGWTNGISTPRELADINNDGRIDIVGFDYAGVLAGLNQSNIYI